MIYIDDDIFCLSRELNIPIVTCIPIEYRNEVENLNALERVGYHLKVPKWMYDKNKGKVEGEIRYINLRYDPLKGIKNELP